MIRRDTHFPNSLLTDGGNLTAILADHPLTPGRLLVLIYVADRLEGLGQQKNPVTSPGNEPAALLL
jgi:hypothetical protein